MHRAAVEGDGQHKVIVPVLYVQVKDVIALIERHDLCSDRVFAVLVTRDGVADTACLRDLITEGKLYRGIRQRDAVGTLALLLQGGKGDRLNRHRGHRCARGGGCGICGVGTAASGKQKYRKKKGGKGKGCAE